FLARRGSHVLGVSAGKFDPQAPKLPIAPIFKAASVTLAVSREKDGKLRLVMPDGTNLCFAGRVMSGLRRFAPRPCTAAHCSPTAAARSPCPVPRGSAAFAPDQRSRPHSHSQRLARWQATQGFLRPSLGCVTPA